MLSKPFGEKPRRLKKILVRIEEGRWPKKGSKAAKHFRHFCRRAIRIIDDLYPAVAAWISFLTMT